MIITEKIAFF